MYSGSILELSVWMAKAQKNTTKSLRYLLKGIQVNLACELRIILIREKIEFCKVTFVSKQGHLNQDINDNRVFIRAVHVKTGCGIWLLYLQERMLVSVAKKVELNLDSSQESSI